MNKNEVCLFRLGNPARVTEKVQSRTLDFKMIDVYKKLQALEDELSRTNNGSKRYEGMKTNKTRYLRLRWLDERDLRRKLRREPRES